MKRYFSAAVVFKKLGVFLVLCGISFAFGVTCWTLHLTEDEPLTFFKILFFGALGTISALLAIYTLVGGTISAMSTIVSDDI